MGARTAFAATLEVHWAVQGQDVTAVQARTEGGPWQDASWDDLDRTPRNPGLYALLVRANAGADGDAVQVPPCAGRRRVFVDSHEVSAPPGALVLPLTAGGHDVMIEIEVSRYERRIACGDRPRLGTQIRTVEGLGVLTFADPFAARGGGQAVVYVPPGHDIHRPGPLLVGTHPWNGTMWTYAAYAELFREARARDVLLLLPSGLGNSLYTSDAEAEVLHALRAVSDVVAVDARAVSIWGASMGGAGATTIGFHNPDRFAMVTSFFGDSKYDLSTYVRAILPDDTAAHRVNALDVVDNARHLPVWLIHGDSDRTSPIHQSEILAAAMQQRGFRVRFDRVARQGHDGALVARFLPEVVAAAATARVPDSVERVTYRSVRPQDVGAYGVRISRASTTGDAFVDLDRRDDAVHVRRADGVRSITLTLRALGTAAEHPPPIVVDDARLAIQVGWEPLQ
jgi:pimeloyl-ACP methyl ester carboxylesterase